MNSESEIAAIDLTGFEAFLKKTLNTDATQAHPALEEFWEGMNYSLFGGGKRFRPMLCLMTAKALNHPVEEVYALASAIEMIHTYSLIHDDLPCLDNDDMRRGRATHHVKFGEDMALLAGDGLLTLAFYTLASNYSFHPKVATLIQEVAKAAGVQGMVGGQVLDMKWESLPASEDLLKKIHELKTGALIALSVRGSALVCGADAVKYQALAKFGEAIGLAFQIADDIEDAREKDEGKNFVSLWGLEKTKAYLKEVSEGALVELQLFGSEAEPLRHLLSYNATRSLPG